MSKRLYNDSGADTSSAPLKNHDVDAAHDKLLRLDLIFIALEMLFTVAVMLHGGWLSYVIEGLLCAGIVAVALAALREWRIANHLWKVERRISLLTSVITFVVFAFLTLMTETLVIIADLGL